LILVEKYDEALAQLKEHFETMDKVEINDFEIYSTLRQLELYAEFCEDRGLREVINLLQKHIPNHRE